MVTADSENPREGDLESHSSRRYNQWVPASETGEKPQDFGQSTLRHTLREYRIRFESGQEWVVEAEKLWRDGYCYED